MMVEDIWAHYEGFSWQKRLLLQSEEKKKKKKRQMHQAVAATALYSKTNEVNLPKKKMTAKEDGK